MMSSVPDADVVITNPTHYAVALKYDSSKKSSSFSCCKRYRLFSFKNKRDSKEIV